MNTVLSVFWAGLVLEVATFWNFCLVDSSSGSYRNQLYQFKIRLQILNLKIYILEISKTFKSKTPYNNLLEKILSGNFEILEFLCFGKYDASETISHRLWISIKWIHRSDVIGSWDFLFSIRAVYSDTKIILLFNTFFRMQVQMTHVGELSNRC